MACVPAGLHGRGEGGAGAGGARPAPVAAAGGMARLRGRTRLLRPAARADLRARRPTATTPSTTSGSTRGSATTRTSTTWSPRPAAAVCGSCSTGCSTMSAVVPGVPRPRSPAGPGSPAARWFRRDPGSGEYATFEGHDELVALDHETPRWSTTSPTSCYWLRPGRGGWRLDVAYAVPSSFWAQVLPRVRRVASRGVVRRRGDPRRLRGLVSRQRPRLGHPVRAVEGDLELAERRRTSSSWPGRWSATAEFSTASVPQTFVGNHDVTRIASLLGPQRAALGPRWPCC